MFLSLESNLEENNDIFYSIYREYSFLSIDGIHSTGGVSKMANQVILGRRTRRRGAGGTATRTLTPAALSWAQPGGSAGRSGERGLRGASSRGRPAAAPTPDRGPVHRHGCRHGGDVTDRHPRENEHRPKQTSPWDTQVSQLRDIEASQEDLKY